MTENEQRTVRARHAELRQEIAHAEAIVAASDPAEEDVGSIVSEYLAPRQRAAAALSQLVARSAS